MKAFLARLSNRERLFVHVGGGVIALLVFIQFMLSPLIEWRTSQREDLDRMRDLHRLVTAAAANAGAPGQSGVDRDTPLRTVVTQTSQTASVNLNLVNVREDGNVEVVASTSDSAALFAWMALLESRYGVRVESADLARDANISGSLRAQISFSRGGA